MSLLSIVLNDFPANVMWGIVCAVARAREVAQAAAAHGVQHGQHAAVIGYPQGPLVPPVAAPPVPPQQQQQQQQHIIGQHVRREQSNNEYAALFVALIGGPLWLFSPHSCCPSKETSVCCWPSMQLCSRHSFKASAVQCLLDPHGLTCSYAVCWTSACSAWDGG